jgi:hypothetical protein
VVDEAEIVAVEITVVVQIIVVETAVAATVLTNVKKKLANNYKNC